MTQLRLRAVLYTSDTRMRFKIPTPWIIAGVFLVASMLILALATTTELANPADTTPPPDLSVAGHGRGGSEIDQVFNAPTLYSVVFHESGLLTGTSWNITINGIYRQSSTSNIVFLLANGTYFYFVGFPSNYSGSHSGQVTVSGMSLQVNLTMSYLSNLRFVEVGLPQGMIWWVNITNISKAFRIVGSTSDLINLTLPVGSYAYNIGAGAQNYTANDSSGVLILGTRTLTVDISFSIAMSMITVVEAGLPQGTLWEANFTLPNGTHATRTSSTSSLNFSGPIGQYGVSAYAQGYTTSESVYTVTLTERNYTLAVNFVVGAHEVTFTESGLPRGTLWWVNLTSQGGSSQEWYSRSSAISLNLTYGFYSFVTASYEFSAMPSQGSFALSSADLHIFVTFIATGPGTINLTVSPTSPSPTLWIDGKGYELSSQGRYVANLSAGIHTIALVLSGYQPFYSNVSIISSRTTWLNVSLHPTSTSIASNFWSIGVLPLAIMGALAIATATLAGAYLSSRRYSHRGGFESTSMHSEDQGPVSDQGPGGSPSEESGSEEKEERWPEADHEAGDRDSMG